MTKSSLEVNDISVNYTDTGTDAFPLIFIHPFPFNQLAWEPQLTALGTSARVITYDLRGFGQTTAGSKELSIAQLADDLVWFMDKLNLSQAIVCGLSMGGYILLNAVERYPQRFKGIILSDTQCLADSKENNEKRYTTIDEIKEKGLEEFATNFIKNAFTEHTLANNTGLVNSTRNLILSNSVHAITSALRAMAERSETCSGLKNIKIPALVLCGKDDKVTPPSLSEFLFTNITGATLYEIEKAAHLANLEQPEEFNRQISSFIKGITV